GVAATAPGHHARCAACAWRRSDRYELVSKTLPIYDWGGHTPLTREQRRQLQAYEESIGERRWLEVCSGCPLYCSPAARSRCCKFDAAPAPSLMTRLKARLSRHATRDP